MKKDNLNVLITGAANGIGLSISKQIISRVNMLILIDNDADNLNEAINDLSSSDVLLRYFVIDMCDQSKINEVYEVLCNENIKIDVLINNAGVGIYGPFVSNEWEEVNRLLSLNIFATTYITQLFSKDMVERGQGEIFIIASTAGFQATPFLSCYGASKSYLISFSEALAEELRPENIQVHCLCPGATKSKFFEHAGMMQTSYVKKISMMPSDEVAKSVIDLLGSNKTLIIVGLMNKIRCFLIRFIPRKLLATISYNRFYKKLS